jgi:membrane protease YdiL (CAAX protease family)
MECFMAAIAAPTVMTTSRLAQLLDNLTIRKNILEARKINLRYIITGIAIAAILSATGILPAAVLTGAMVGILSPVVPAAAVILSKTNRNSASNDQSKYRMFSQDVWNTCIIAPIVEEVIFRVILQGSLQCIFKRVLPAVAITVFGAQIPLYACAAMIVAGSAFGVLHLKNSHNLSKVQAVVAGFAGICFSGPLYYYYGLWATCMEHIVHNTALMVLSTMGEPKEAERNRAVSQARL